MLAGSAASSAAACRGAPRRAWHRARRPTVHVPAVQTRWRRGAWRRDRLPSSSCVNGPCTLNGRPQSRRRARVVGLEQRVGAPRADLGRRRQLGDAQQRRARAGSPGYAPVEMPISEWSSTRPQYGTVFPVKAGVGTPGGDAGSACLFLLDLPREAARSLFRRSASFRTGKSRVETGLGRIRWPGSGHNGL